MQLLQKALADQATPAGADPSRDSMAGVVWTPSMRRMYTLTDRYAVLLSLRRCSPLASSPTHDEPLICYPCLLLPSMLLSSVK